MSLSKDVFERSTLTGSGLFAFLSSGLAHFLRQIVSIRVRTLSNSNLVVPSYIKEIGPHFRLTRVTPKRPESNELRRRARKNAIRVESDKAITFLASGNFHTRLRNSPSLDHVREKYYFL